VKTLYLIRRMNIPARLSPPAINATRTRHPPRSHSLHLSKNTPAMQVHCRQTLCFHDRRANAVSAKRRQ